MTIRKHLPTIHIHPILLLFFGIAFLTGMFMELFIIICIVFIHELGHYIMAVSFKWRIRSIMLWIFGGVMDTDEHGNKPIYEEFLVTLAGPFQHLIIYAILIFVSSSELLPSSVIELAFYYNTAILLFNLLPIWPLDGGKLLFLIFSALLPYRKAYYSIIIFSMISSLVLIFLQIFILPFTLSVFFIVIFLFMENWRDWQQRYYVFIRFLLKRYHDNPAVKCIHPIHVPFSSSLMDVFAQFKRERKHAIYITMPGDERRHVDEAECLHTFFHDKNYSVTIGEVVINGN